MGKLAGLGESTGDGEGEMKLGYVSGWVTAGSSAKIKITEGSLTSDNLQMRGLGIKKPQGIVQ